MNHSELTRVARRLAIEAGNKIMEIYNSDDFDVKVKSDASPVTEADEAADALISAGLRAAFPDVALVTEEQADSHDVSAMTFLIVDPLDGTKEFINRRGDFTVNIAYVEDGVPVRGVVYAPAKERMFYTDSTGQSVVPSGLNSVPQLTLVALTTPVPVTILGRHRFARLLDACSKSLTGTCASGLSLDSDW